MNDDNNVDIMKSIEDNERKQLEVLMQKNNSKIDIVDIIYLGKIKNLNIYRVSEDDNKDNYTKVLHKYFDENYNLKGVKSIRPDGLEQWIYLDEELEQIRDEIDKNEAQLKEIDEILEEYGLSQEDVSKITEVDLEQRIREQEEKSKEENKSEATSKYTNVLNEVETNKFVDQKGTELGEALGLEQYSKLLIVHADNVRDIKDADGKHYDTPTKRLAVLGVREVEGKKVIEPIPQDVLDYDRRSNTHSVRFDDNEEVEKNTGTYERFVNPKTNRGISIEMSEMETKVFYQGGIDLYDNTAVMERVEDGRTGWVEAETKGIFNYNHGKYKPTDIKKEIGLHQEDKGEEVNRENGDGDLDSVSGHIHKIETPSDEIAFDGEVMTVERAAEKMDIPVHMFIQEYNKRAKELEGEEKIDLKEDLYDEIEERAEERLENEPKREEGGYALGDNINQRGE